MRQDNHLHTSWSDGKNTAAQMAECAVALGLSRITVTDHVRRSTMWLPEYIAAVRALRQEYAGRLEIAVGVECKITGPEGGIDFDAAFRDEADVVLAAVHRVPMGEGAWLRASEVDGSNAGAACEAMQRAMLAALENPLVDVLAHPFQRGAHPFLKAAFTPAFCDKLARVAIQNDKYLEKNYSKYNGCVDEGYWKRAGLKVWRGSDSHSVEDMRRYAPAMAADAGEWETAGP